MAAVPRPPHANARSVSRAIRKASHASSIDCRSSRYNPLAMTDHVIVENSGGVLTLTLNRPDKKNALTAAMYEVVTRALDDASQDASVGCVLIQGNGDSFSAGNDLAEFAAINT